MRYHYEAPALNTKQLFGALYFCDHPVYTKCTLFKDGPIGLAVIQQRHSKATKHTWWGELDPGLANDIFLHPRFHSFFVERAGKPNHGLYPTVSIRQLMWALKMKPLKRERWETCFDRKDI